MRPGSLSDRYQHLKRTYFPHFHSLFYLDNGGISFLRNVVPIKLQGITSQKNVILTNTKCTSQVGSPLYIYFTELRMLTRSIHVCTGLRNKETHSLTHVGLERGKGQLDVSDVPILYPFPPHNIILHTRSSRAISFYLCSSYLDRGSYQQLNAISRATNSL